MYISNVYFFGSASVTPSIKSWVWTSRRFFPELFFAPLQEASPTLWGKLPRLWLSCPSPWRPGGETKAGAGQALLEIRVRANVDTYGGF